MGTRGAASGTLGLLGVPLPLSANGPPSKAVLFVIGNIKMVALATLFLDKFSKLQSLI